MNIKEYDVFRADTEIFFIGVAAPKAPPPHYITEHLIKVQSVGGSTPRHFKIHPNGKLMLVGLQDANEIESFKIDPSTGLLSDAHIMFCPNHPTMIGLLNI